MSTLIFRKLASAFIRPSSAKSRSEYILSAFSVMVPIEEKPMNEMMTAMAIMIPKPPSSFGFNAMLSRNISLPPVKNYKKLRGDSMNASERQ